MFVIASFLFLRFCSISNDIGRFKTPKLRFGDFLEENWGEFWWLKLGVEEVNLRLGEVPDRFRGIPSM